MSQPAKKIKVEMRPDELNSFREEIKKIGAVSAANEEQQQQQDDESDELKKYIRDMIRQSERRIQQRLDTLEHKLNRLLERKFEKESSPPVEALMSEDGDDHIIEELVEEDTEIHDEFSSQIFPIIDEETFDWFMMRLKDDNYRHTLVSRRWQLTRNCGTRSFNVSVKDFIRMHFELSVCIKYSVSGYGSRGTKKKKLDSQSLTKYIFDCFNKSQPGIHSFHEVSKAVTNYWGRSPDTYAKSGERAVKSDITYEFI